MIKVLVVTSDAALERMLRVTLTINGLTVVSVALMSEITASLAQDKFHILLLDEAYADLTSTLRAKGFDVPILVLGKAMPTKSENVTFLAKPFSFPELKSSMNEVFHKQIKPADREMVFGDIRIDVSRSIIQIQNQVVKLGKLELAIFISLVKKTGSIVTMEKLRKDLEVQGHYFNTAIFHHIKELKRKVKEATNENVLIRSVTGQGYQLIQT